VLTKKFEYYLYTYGRFLYKTILSTYLFYVNTGRDIKNGQ